MGSDSMTCPICKVPVRVKAGHTTPLIVVYNNHLHACRRKRRKSGRQQARKWR